MNNMFRRPDGISVVTPTLNAAHFLSACLESVARQDGDVEYEHIVVDGGSTDNTILVAQEYQHVRVLNLPGAGQSTALNAGFTEAKFSIVCWLNADDVLLEHAFLNVVRLYSSLGARFYLYSDWAELDVFGNMTGVRVIPWISWFVIRNFTTYIPTSGSFMSRTIVDEGFRLRDELDIIMDRAFVLDLYTAGYSFVKCQAPIAGFRIHENQKSSKGRVDQKRLEERRSVTSQYGGVWMGTKRVIRQNYLLRFTSHALLFVLLRFVRLYSLVAGLTPGGSRRQATISQWLRRLSMTA